MEVEIKKPQDLDIKTLEVLEKLSFKYEGQLYFRCQDMKVGWFGTMDEIYIAKEAEEIVGWAVREDKVHFQIFVDPYLRGRGIGTAIVKTAYSSLKSKLKVYPHDDASHYFFRKLSLKLNGEYVYYR